MKRLLIYCTLMLLVSMPVLADWDLDDPAKFIQLPDPTGWDVKSSYTTPVRPPLNGVATVIADDFICTQTGWITDYHWWGSWKNDNVGELVKWTVAIFEDDNNKPGRALNWVLASSVEVREVFPSSDQGWLDPETGEWQRPNHERYFQYNLDLTPLGEGFWVHQEEGTRYWFSVTVQAEEGAEWGWKTSMDHSDLDAIYGKWPADPLNEPFVWEGELIDPITTESLDMAFVLTTIPEPGTLVLAGLGALALLRRRRRV